jgi:hypothetical protein
MSHTPGPWRHAPTGPTMRGYSQPFGVASVDYGPAFLVCGCFGDIKGGPDEAEANARLIAAAPELLAALKECAERLQPHIKHTEDLVAHMSAVKAIAKATGEQP